MIRRGSICWADLGEVRGSRPAKRRPVLIIQADPFNASRLKTTLAADAVTTSILAVVAHTTASPLLAAVCWRRAVLNATEIGLNALPILEVDGHWAHSGPAATRFPEIGPADTAAADHQSSPAASRRRPAWAAAAAESSLPAACSASLTSWVSEREASSSR